MNTKPKYQVIEVVGIDGFFGAWQVVNCRTNKEIKTFQGDDSQSEAMDYAQQLVEDDNWNAANR